MSDRIEEDQASKAPARAGAGAAARSWSWRRRMATIGIAALQAVVAAGFIGGAIAGAGWLIATKPQIGRQAASEPIYAVEAVTVRTGEVRPSFSVFGAVEARRSVEMRALVAGEIVHVNDSLVVGGRLAGGAELVQIDRFSYEGAVVEAEANLDEARAQLTEAEARLANEQTAFDRAQEQLIIGERDLERSENLARRGAGSEATVDDRRFMVSQRRQTSEAAANAIVTREAEIDRLGATLKRLEWRLEQARRDLRDTKLKAPFDAVVRSENVEVGRRLSVNDVVADLYAADSLDVRFTVSDRQFGRLRDARGAGDAGLLGRRVLVSWAIGDAPVTAEAVVDRIGSDVSATRGGVELIGRIAPTAPSAADGGFARLKPGAVVSVTVPDRVYPAAVRAPETALFNGDHVYVVVEDAAGVTRLERRAVQTLAWDGNDVILRGAPPEAIEGARVMVTRLAEAGDGVRVEVLSDADAPPSPAAALN